MWIKKRSSNRSQSGGTVPEEETRAAAVRQLFEAHNRKLIRFLLARLQNEQDAIEVAQEAYVQLLQLEKPGNVSLLEAYLFRIARNIAVDRVRQRRVRSEYLLDAAADSVFEVDLEGEYLAGEELQLFWSAVRELPEKCRRAFVATKFQELSAETIAQELEVSPRMVRKYVVQALVYCRLRLDGIPAQAAAFKMRAHS